MCDTPGKAAKQKINAAILTGWCLTPTLLLICSSFSRENGYPLLICSSLSTAQLNVIKYLSLTTRAMNLCFFFVCSVFLPVQLSNNGEVFLGAVLGGACGFLGFLEQVFC